MIRKWTQHILLSADLMTLIQDVGHQKWEKMVEVNGAYTHRKRETIWNVCMYCPTLKLLSLNFLRQPDKHDR